MKIEYERKADALYIQFRQATVEDNLDVEEGVTIDLGDDGHIVGIEILAAQKRFGVKGIANIRIQGLPVEGIAE